MESDDEKHYAEESHFLEILKKRQRRLKGPKTLKCLCLSSIKIHTKFFLQVEQETGLNPFNCISNEMKIELLGDFYAEWGRWEELLVNNHVTSVAIGSDFCETVPYDSIWHSLLLEKVQLTNLCWKGTDLYNPYREHKILDSNILACICRSAICANLQKLELMQFVCTDVHLKKFACILNQLSVLSLELKGVTANGISALSKLEHLREFLFKWVPADSADGTTAYNLCLQLIPKLQVVGNHDWTDVENYNPDQDVDAKFHIDFKLIPTPTELGLRQLILHDQDGDIPEGITFPNLTCLRLWESIENFRFDARFSKVTELSICYLGMEKSSRVLNHLGHQLKKLHFVEEDSEETMYLDVLIRFCPNLEELSILENPQKLTFSSSLEPDTDLCNLKILRMDLSTFLYTLMPPGVVVQLLRAPNLSYAKLIYVEFTKEEVEMMVHLLQNGQMLQKLEKFEVRHLETMEEMDSDEEDEDDFFRKEEKEVRDLYDLLLLNMAKYCPRFVQYEELCD